MMRSRHYQIGFNPDYSSRKHKMSKRARHVGRIRGLPDTHRKRMGSDWVKRYLCFQRRFNPRIQVGPKAKFPTVCVPSKGGIKRRRARHLWYDYSAKKQPQRTEHAMPETIPQIRPSFNRSLRLETRPELLSADTGALVQRELMERSGLIDWLKAVARSATPEFDPLSAADLLRTRLLLLGQGWRDQSDADRLRQDPSLRVASQTRRGTAARRATGWRHSRPCPDYWTRSAGRRTFRSCTRR